MQSITDVQDNPRLPFPEVIIHASFNNFVFFGHAYSLYNFPGQGLNPYHSSDNHWIFFFFLIFQGHTHGIWKYPG